MWFVAACCCGSRWPLIPAENLPHGGSRRRSSSVAALGSRSDGRKGGTMGSDREEEKLQAQRIHST